MMGLALLDLGWTPQQYWDSTPHEFWAAYEIILLRNKKR
jgi:Phage tail assembly chaperone protein, TAC